MKSSPFGIIRGAESLSIYTIDSCVFLLNASAILFGQCAVEFLQSFGDRLNRFHIKLQLDVGEVVGRFVIVLVVFDAEVDERDLCAVEGGLVGLVGPVLAAGRRIVVTEQ